MVTIIYLVYLAISRSELSKQIAFAFTVALHIILNIGGDQLNSLIF